MDPMQIDAEIENRTSLSEEGRETSYGGGELRAPEPFSLRRFAEAIAAAATELRPLAENLASALDPARTELLQVTDEVDTFVSGDLLQIPPLKIAFVGETGVGKSTLINALLQRHVSFQSGAGVGTTVPVEIAYSNGDILEADIHMIPEADLKSSIDRALHYLRDSSGESGDEFGEADLDEDEDGAKLKALFPVLSASRAILSMDVEAVLRQVPELHSNLGRSITVSSTDDAEFVQQIQKYTVAQSDDPREPCFWPVVNRVCIKANSPILRGAVFVDLPGIGDRNAARVRTTALEMVKYDHVVICGRIDRITGSVFIKEVLNQLKPSLTEFNGTPNFTIVATRADCCNIKEIKADRNIGAHSDQGFTNQEARLRALESAAVTVGTKLKQCASQRNAHNHQDCDERRGTSVGQKRLPTPTCSTSLVKRLRLSSDSEGPSRGTPIIDRTDNNPVDIKPSSSSKPTSQEREAELARRYAVLKDKVIQSRLALSATATNLRSKYISRSLRSQDIFRNICKQPQQIPVFAVGLDDFERLNEGLQLPQCFRNVSETGVPAVKNWLTHLVDEHALRAVQIPLDHLSTSARRLSEVLNIQGRTPDQHSRGFKARWAPPDADAGETAYCAASCLNPDQAHLIGESSGYRAQTLMECAKTASSFFQNLRHKIQSSISLASERGRKNATSSKALTAAISAVVDKNLHHNRLQWILVKRGIWCSRDRSFHIDIPKSLLRPFERAITSEIDSHYSGNTLSALMSGLTAAFRQSLDQVCASINDPAFRAVLQPHANLSKRHIRAAMRLLDNELRKCRQFQASVIDYDPKKQLKSKIDPIYDTVLSIKGRGSTQLRKAKFTEAINQEAAPALAHVAAYTIEQLHRDVDELETMAAKAVFALAMKIERNLAATWSDVQENRTEVIACTRYSEAAGRILARLEAWEMSIAEAQRRCRQVVNQFPPAY